MYSEVSRYCCLNAWVLVNRCLFVKATTRDLVTDQVTSLSAAVSSSTALQLVAVDSHHKDTYKRYPIPPSCLSVEEILPSYPTERLIPEFEFRPSTSVALSTIMSDPEREQGLEDYKKSLLELREWEAKLRTLRLGIKDLQREFDVSEENIKALQSVGQIIGEVLKQLDEERCTFFSSLLPALWLSAG